MAQRSPRTSRTQRRTKHAAAVVLERLNSGKYGVFLGADGQEHVEDHETHEAAMAHAEQIAETVYDGF